MIADGVEILKEEWSENTRRQRRSLLLVSTISIVIVATGWFPTQISTLGITLDLKDRQTAFWLLFMIENYFLATFISCVVPESIYRNIKIHYNLNIKEKFYYPWQMAIFYTGLRTITDFALPLLVATIAIFCLVWAGFNPNNVGKLSSVFTWVCRIIATGLLIFTAFNFFGMIASFLPSMYAVLKTPKNLIDELSKLKKEKDIKVKTKE